MTERHTIPPVFDKNSRILILGSFPSVRSREVGFFYGHPQNRFWRVLALVFGDTVPMTVEEKKGFLTAHGIALWDVIASCSIEGSSDSSIRNVVPNDIAALVAEREIRAVFTNGRTAQSLYDKYIRSSLDMEATCLPSTSPANASWSVEKLTEAWNILCNPS